MKSTDYELIHVDPNREVFESFQLHFKRFDNVAIEHMRFQDLEEFDCMVSAANSFGLMDGGVDGAITAYFGLQLMDRVQEHIVTKYRGEQPVGTSFILETNNEWHPFLAHTPTMRTPMACKNRQCLPGDVGNVTCRLESQ